MVVFKKTIYIEKAINKKCYECKQLIRICYK